MKTIIYIAACFILSCKAKVDREPNKIKLDSFSESYHVKIDTNDVDIRKTQPFYIGGYDSFYNFTVKELKRYNLINLLDSADSLYYLFDVKENGELDNIYIARSNSSCTVCDSIGFEILKNSPTWIPSYKVNKNRLVLLDSPIVSTGGMLIRFNKPRED